MLANRLTENGRHRVLLLEAGGNDDRFFVSMPIGYGKCFFDPDVNWMYRTEPEAALAGRSGYWPRGKLLGGSSSINAMVFVRGQPADFDEWEAAGNPGWGWRDVLPWFRRLEDSSRGASEWRGAGGPQAVADVSADAHPLCELFLRAGEQAGAARNRRLQRRVVRGRRSLRDHRARRPARCSTARAYLQPARRRANLAVETAGAGDRASASKAGARARCRIGSGGAQRSAVAAREVVLCAGAINTPQLLQLSGVGPAAQLQALGIAIVHDSPAVGAHLQDHLCIDYLYRSRVPSLNEELRPWHGKLRAGLRYLVQRRGPLALSVNQAGGFVRSRPGLARPDLQLYFSPLSYTRSPEGKRPLMSPDPFPGFLLSAQPCRPTSRGSVSLRSPDPLAAPRIEPNSLATPEDLDALVQGARFLRRLAATPALSAVIDSEMAPGAAGADARATGRGHPRARLERVPPGQHVPHGPRSARRRGRSPAARARPRRAAHRRRLGVSRRDLGQHQCAGDHGRREGRRPDPRRCGDAVNRRLPTRTIAR